MFIPDLEDVKRAQAVVGGYARTRLEIVASRPGNPMGASVRDYNEAVALRAAAAPSPQFNRAFGFSDDLVDEMPDLIAWYDAGMGAVFELAPGREITKITRLLQDAGYSQSGFHATFAGALDEASSANIPDVDVRPVESAEDLRSFGDAYHAGWQISAFRIPMDGWLNAHGWSLYLAACDGKAAGAAVSYTMGESVYLADSAVAPEFRRRGVHRALLDRRCEEARERGARHVYSGADFLSASARNMQRKGLKLLYTEAIWSGLKPSAR
jgi:GNAT superfamily N-acetyltransferase